MVTWEEKVTLNPHVQSVIDRLLDGPDWPTHVSGWSIPGLRIVVLSKM